MQFASPLVHVIVQPMLFISTLHVPIMPMLQQQHIMPFIIMQQLIIPPCIIMQRLFIISADVLSSQVQTTFMPPLTFSIFIVQRGIIIPPLIMLVDIGLMPGIIPIIDGIAPMPGIIPIDPMAGIPIPGIIRSLVIMLLIANSFFLLNSFLLERSSTRREP